MFERFTAEARATAALAAEEARAAGHPAVGTEHILLGLLHAPETIAARTLTSFDGDLSEARLAVRRALGWADPIEGEIPFTPAAQRALERAGTEAVVRGRGDVEPEDLLRSLLADQRAGAAHILLELGVTPYEVRAELEVREADAADPNRLALWPGLEPTLADGELEVGWRARAIALAALGAAVLGRSAFDAHRTGQLKELEMQLLVYLALAHEAEPASNEHPGEAVNSLPAALACDRGDVHVAVDALRSEQLVIRPVDSDDDRIAITPAGLDCVERWLARTASLFGGWPPDRPDVDDATG